MRSGIYRIRNIITKECYYGSTVNFSGRWSQHKKELSNNVHYNLHLQCAWNKYGEESFIFEIVEDVLDKSNLIRREQWYLDNEKCEYNIAKTAGGGDLGEEVNIKKRGKNHPFYGKKRPDHSIRMKGENHPFYNKSRPEWIGNISGEGHPFYGKHHSEETKKMMSTNRKGNPNFKKPKSEEHKRKISESIKNRWKILKTESERILECH